MRRSGMISVLAVALAACTAAATAQQRFPPPEFEPTYHQPPTTYPPTGPPWADWADLGVLAGLLVAAAVLSLRFRRRWAIVALSVVALLYLGFYRGGCVCPIGAIQNVAAALLVKDYVLPLTVAGFFLLPLLFSLISGRSFCAGVCPLGAAQDLVAVKPLSVPAWLDESLGLLAYVYLGAAVMFVAAGAGFFICQYDPFVSIFRLVPLGKMLEGAARREPVDVYAVSGRIDTLLLAAAFVATGLFVARPYCRWLCPYGVLLGWLSKLSFWRVTVTPEDCVKCRLCEDACPFGAIRKPSAEAPSRQRLRGKAALLAAMGLLPVLLVGGGLLGGLLGPGMARAHWTVRLADRIRDEDAGTVKGATDESKAFRETARTSAELFAEADGIVAQFDAKWPLTRVVSLGLAGGSRGPRVGMAHLLGALVGLVIGLKLIGLTVRRRTADYEPDRFSCLSCGRCFAYCPIEQARRKGSEVVIDEAKIK